MSLFSTKRKRIALGIMLGAVVIFATPVAYAYAVIPGPIRNPKLEHYHFRMQVLVNGKAEDFSEDKYQQDYAKDQCNANLPEQPVHFHDSRDQMVHIHWEGMTGGMVMKYYGWNFIGGIKNGLGYTLNDFSNVQRVNTHGNFLPEIPEGGKFYVYSGDQGGYKQRDFKEWVNEDLEKFFDTQSNFPLHAENVKPWWKKAWEKVVPPTEAHGGEEGAHEHGEGESEEERLTRINNLIGNVVIFVQKDAPSEERIQARFNDLEPLGDSTCGG